MKPPEYSKRAAKYINGLDKPSKLRIKDACEKIPKGDVKPMEGRTDGTYRLRVGKFRIVFKIINNTAIIEDIGSRGDIYK